MRYFICYISRPFIFGLKIAALSDLMSLDGPYYSGEVTESQFVNQYLNLNASEISSLAHQPQDFIRKCSIRGNAGDKKCAELINGSKRIFSPDRGVCYMFNNVHQNYTNTSFQIDNAGPKNGLALKICAESKIYHNKRNTV